jgi:aspartate aminotransferase-like enzyme
MSRPMINHRGPEFKEMLLRITDRLKQVFKTKGDMFILTASGTGAMEASIVNTLSPGDHVLGTTSGSFGDRYCRIAEIFGCNVTRLEGVWGEAITPAQIREALGKDLAIKAVIVTHNETATGVTNDLEGIAKVVKGEFNKLLLVDAISSMACIPVHTDEWKCDVVMTASQKGFRVPPGLAFISFSKQAWEAYKTAKCPKLYFDLGPYKKFLEERGQPPYTPNVSLHFALDRALDQMLKEGMEKIYADHRRTAKMLRDGVTALGLEIFPKTDCVSDTITAVKIPEGMDWRKMLALLREEHDVVLAGGYTKLEGKVFRIGHLGKVSEAEIQGVLDALKVVLPKVGFKPKR